MEARAALERFWPRRGRAARAVLAPFTVVLACFVASSVVAQQTASSIEDAAHDITLNATPSIERLAAARGGLRAVEEIVTEAVNTPGDVRRGRILSARRDVDANLRGYLALEAFPGERDMWLDVEHELAQFDVALDQVMRCLDASDVTCARSLLHGELRDATDRTDNAAVRVIAFNAGHAHDLAQRIAVMRARSEHTAWVLDALSAFLAIVTAYLAVRSARRYERLQDAHRTLAERRADELEQFAARVAHDVLGPLTTVNLALQLVERQGALDDRTRQPVAGALASVRRVRAIVDGLLEFARAGAGPVPAARADVPAVLEDVVASLGPIAAERNVDLALEDVERPCAVACSAGVLTSLVSNLARNAIKYVGEGPGRRVRVRVLPARGERYARVEVEDNGPGVPEALRATVFEPYVRAPDTRQPGIGLGLATVKKLARAHGGDVGLLPAPSGGSVFWFELPRAKPPDAVADPTSAPAR